MIHLNHRRDLCPSPTKEELVTDVELTAVNRSLGNLDPKLAGDLNHRSTRDPFKDVVVRARGDQRVTTQEEEVLR